MVPEDEVASSYITNFYATLATKSDSIAYGVTTLGPEIVNVEVDYPQYIWVNLGQPPSDLFTTGADTVDFNALTSDQQSAVADGADLYNGRGGNDVVTLPSVANYNESVGGGKTLGWDPGQTFSTGSLAGQKYTVNGGDGSYNIALGAGNDTVTITGNGNNSISLGSGNNTVKISGTGNNTISDGTGASDLIISDFSGQLTGSSDPIIDVTSDSTGNATIGSGDTLELSEALNGLITFGSPGGTLEIERTDIPPLGLFATINGFASGDTIDFADQRGLTTTAVFGGSLEVYSGTNEIAVLNLGSDSIADAIVPQNDGSGGTKIVFESVPIGPQQLNPSGTQIDWGYIQQHEKLELAPYVPKAKPDVSGVTVGYGVDLAHLFSATYFASNVFPSYTSNPNLLYLYGAIVPTLTGALARTYLAEGTGQTATIDNNPASQYVSVTTYDANQLTYEAELYKLSVGPGTQSLVGFWSKYGFGSIYKLPALAQTSLYDLFYNGLITYNSTIMEDFVSAAESISSAAPLGASSTWASLATDLLLAGGVNPTRKVDDGDLTNQILIQIVGQSTNLTIPTMVQSGATTGARTSYSIMNTSLNSLYGFDPSGSQDFTLTEAGSSPNFASIVMPSSWDGSYLVSYETGSTWSSPQQAQPLQTITLPTGVDGLQVTLLNSNGDPVTSQNDFTFFVSFASAGTFSGTVTSPLVSSNLRWQNTSGSVALWDMNRTSLTGSAVVADPGPNWHAIGTGDFDGDGQSDILLQNTNGSVAVWDMNGTSLTSSAVVADPGPNWHAIGTGDFDGDGQSDILLQNTNGSVAVWDMSGTDLTGSAAVANPGPSWRTIGTGDFNGDGQSDILLQNTNGSVAVWDMNGGRLTGSAVVADPGPNWHAIGTGDFNGDGQSDILLQNTNGSVAIWEMNGTSLSGSAVVANPGAQVACDRNKRRRVFLHPFSKRERPNRDLVYEWDQHRQRRGH